MLDKSFAKWWLSRVVPFRDVPPEKLAAEREAMQRQQEYNNNYAEFLNNAVFPAVDALVQVLNRNSIIHRVSTWGNQLSLRVHLAWRWGELVIMQSHEDAVTFEHHVITEGEDGERTRPRTIPINTICATRCRQRWRSRNCSSFWAGWPRTWLSRSRSRSSRRARSRRPSNGVVTGPRCRRAVFNPRGTPDSR